MDYMALQHGWWQCRIGGNLVFIGGGGGGEIGVNLSLQNWSMQVVIKTSLVPICATLQMQPALLNNFFASFRCMRLILLLPAQNFLKVRCLFAYTDHRNTSSLGLLTSFQYVSFAIRVHNHVWGFGPLLTYQCSAWRAWHRLPFSGSHWYHILITLVLFFYQVQRIFFQLIGKVDGEDLLSNIPMFLKKKNPIQNK